MSDSPSVICNKFPSLQMVGTWRLGDYILQVVDQRVAKGHETTCVERSSELNDLQQVHHQLLICNERPSPFFFSLHNNDQSQ
mmetsp:Transcript_69158/g.122128  ORF Transcript_69158/g.122128 Transcript_69158/m.122128 type:complete len:82 (-) Transcript_69158:156-401(-)